MASLERDFAGYMEDQGFGTVGTDIFIGYQNNKTPNDCIIVDNQGGGQPDRDLPLRDTDLQLIVRNEKYNTGQQKAEEILEKITRTTWKSLGTGRKFILFIHGTTGIMDLGKDINGRYEFAFTFTIRFRQVNQVITPST